PQLAAGVRDQRRAMADRAQAVDGEQHLVLTAAPGARGVDMKGEHRGLTMPPFDMRKQYRCAGRGHGLNGAAGAGRRTAEEVVHTHMEPERSLRSRESSPRWPGDTGGPTDYYAGEVV